MRLLDQWASKWQIHPSAIHELKQIMSIGEFMPMPEGGESEAAVQKRKQLEASANGDRLWRNNVGACKDEKGNFIRYGLCNESARVNSMIKSSDLIGITQVIITQDMVGSTIGQFTAVEVKHAGWNPKKKLDAHEQGQAKFLMLVISLGGRAYFSNGSELTR